MPRIQALCAAVPADPVLRGEDDAGGTGGGGAQVHQLEGPGHHPARHHVLDSDPAPEVGVGVQARVVAVLLRHASVVELGAAVLVHVATRRQRQHADGVEREGTLVTHVPHLVEHRLGRPRLRHPVRAGDEHDVEQAGRDVGPGGQHGAHPGGAAVVDAHERLADRADRLDAPALAVADAPQGVRREREHDRLHRVHLDAGVVERPVGTLLDELGERHVVAAADVGGLAEADDADVAHSHSLPKTIAAAP